VSLNPVEVNDFVVNLLHAVVGLVIFVDLFVVGDLY